MEKFLNYKMDFEDLQNNVAYFEELKRRAANNTINSVNIRLKKKTLGMKNKKDNWQVNTYDKSGADKSADINSSKKKKSASKWTKTHEANKESLSYPINPP